MSHAGLRIKKTSPLLAQAGKGKPGSPSGSPSVADEEGEDSDELDFVTDTDVEASEVEPASWQQVTHNL